ncbi:hypothetical protein ACH347_33330 [Saccharopolyspora sp. 5N102]
MVDQGVPVVTEALESPGITLKDVRRQV